MNLKRIYDLLPSAAVIYGVIGLVVSLVAHELFHILLHLDGIEHIAVFPDSHAVVAVTTTVTPGYDIDLEELIAYSITLVIIVITIFDVTAIRDSRSKKSSIEVLFPKDHDFDRSTFHEIAARTKLI